MADTQSDPAFAFVFAFDISACQKQKQKQKQEQDRIWSLPSNLELCLSYYRSGFVHKVQPNKYFNNLFVLLV